LTLRHGRSRTGKRRQRSEAVIREKIHICVAQQPAYHPVESSELEGTELLTFERLFLGGGQLYSKDVTFCWLMFGEVQNL
jgi:hypothetical protein